MAMVRCCSSKCEKTFFNSDIFRRSFQGRFSQYAVDCDWSTCAKSRFFSHSNRARDLNWDAWPSALDLSETGRLMLFSLLYMYHNSSQKHAFSGESLLAKCCAVKLMPFADEGATQATIWGVCNAEITRSVVTPTSLHCLTKIVHAALYRFAPLLLLRSEVALH